MYSEGTATDWETVDPWWVTYTTPPSIACTTETARVVDSDRLTDCWAAIDQWWHTYCETDPVVHGPTATESVVTSGVTDSWTDLDAWWDIYTATGHETAVDLAALLDQSTEAWAAAAGPFDSDPLAADLTLTRVDRGPLQPSNEMGWSRWLARVLAPSGALVAELFDVAVEGPPETIIREDRLATPDGSVRRPDILVCYPDRGISIEVKLGDEHYEKTAETARLVEQEYNDKDWTHVLLVPRWQADRLESIVAPPVTKGHDGQRRVEWADPGPIRVCYWRDVTAAIRSLLLQGTVVDDHWAANAYQFCAVAEQRLLGFQPQSVIDRLADPVTVVDALQPIALADTLAEQLSYLRSGLDA